MYGPSFSSTSALRSRMLPNVPRIITSWCPRRAPYELKSSGATPCAWSHGPAGDHGRDRARRADVVGRDRVAEHREDAGALDVAQRRGIRGEALEERRVGDVRRARDPRRSGRPPGSAARATGRRPRTRTRTSRGTAPASTESPMTSRTSSGDGPDVREHDRRAVRRRCRAARSSGRCRPGRRARTRRRAAATRGSDARDERDGSGPRSCGCPRARPRRPAVRPRPRRRSARRAGRSCRCTSCSRSPASAKPSAASGAMSPARSR